MKFTTSTEFVRSLEAVKKNPDGSEVRTRFTSQPYLVGMYVCIEPGTVQLSQTHKQFKSWVKGSIKKMESNGFTVTTTTQQYGDWFSKEEIETYIN